ncbi:hypothetical protein [Streptomyces alanosinicus]|uniref:Uncharacterized protein n=1 Tax=Streptomyces alanosinicus TaxID=68171 RepID=A0A918YQS5_9ACTN|nr:hypothetical protein [Streptomyces alanosinicus]GHE11951.1 hypothetical protein GCM10010339_73510 [Streptomyces alanosinicus]
MRRTLFSLLLQERQLLRWEAFCVHFAASTRELAHESGNRRLASVTVGRTTFDRWSSGTWFGRPRGEAAQVLERMFGHTVDVLFSPADGSDSIAKPITEAAERIASRWTTSRLLLPADALVGTWELSGRQNLDGTSAAVHFLPVARCGDDTGAWDMNADGLHELERFLRPARRGFLVGVENRDNDPQFYVRDAGPARRAASSGMSTAGMTIPSAYLLDDLTYGILWSLTQLDDGLLADDQALDAEQRLLSTYLALPRSAPSRMFVDLTSVGTSWVGSAFCAQHIQHQLADATTVPTFWTREQSGEEAAPWLFFQHKIEYLRALNRFHSTASPTTRVFCLPNATVTRSERYERILLLLAIALMEHFGIRVRVIPKPEYSDVDGVALVPGQRAVVANWVRVHGEVLWAASTTTSRGDLRTYAEVFGDAQDEDLLVGTDTEGRLRSLADYLDIDWAWLTSRCRSLGEHGVADLVRPRSRLLTVEAVDEALAFLGALAPDR